ncbi:Crp/Fnr family transcriptional regulator [Thalassococcus sp. S3]|uniref:Crp/Fnr family transcriptional regulator n=1 Tax=Thalassococcus sp. S3 TaxID=2017482 RepID=UPI001023FD41|nr:Crp/Fnr family transcriptional regulator [Thalassococcus sp. S3]QBF31194.1 cyclic nucleotide-binding protein [Thalassococcus sp. S3]
MSSVRRRIQADLIYRFLTRVPLLKDLCSEKLRSLSQEATLLECPKKHVIFDEGDTCASGYVIMKGLVDAIWFGDDGREVICQTHRRHEALGLHDTADDLRRAATCICVTDTILIRIPPRQFRQLIDAPEVQNRLARTARKDMRHFREGYRRVTMYDLETRLALYLHDLKRTEASGDHVIIEDTQLRIASKVHASRTRVNTTIKKWVDRGEITYSSNTVVFREAHSFWSRYGIEAD